MISLGEREVQQARQELAAECAILGAMLRGFGSGQNPTETARHIHAIRKLGKSLRGGFVLFGLADSSGREIQAIGRLFSAPRDASSRLKTWQRLGWDGDPALARAIGELLEQATLGAAVHPPAATLDWCADRAATAGGHLDNLAATDLADRVAHGLEKLHARVLKRCRKLERGGADDFHEARKALKAYLGALQFLPGHTAGLPPAMGELPELLGDENDLGTLAGWLRDHGFSPRFAPGLWQALGRRRDRLRLRALRKARELTGA